MSRVLILVFLLAIVISTGSAFAATPECTGSWFGFERTYNKKDRDADLIKNCTGGKPFKRLDHQENTNKCDPSTFSCLAELNRYTCMRVCDFEGKHTEAMCGEPPPGKHQTKGDATRLGCFVGPN